VEKEVRDSRTPISMVYITAEQANTRSFNKLLDDIIKQERLAYIVIDEAHCISEWGHDFRPDYRTLGNKLKHKTGAVPWIALTATATTEVIADISKILMFREGFRRMNIPCRRKNIFYDVYSTDDVEDSIDHLTKYILNCTKHLPHGSLNSSGIVYCWTREDTEKMARILSDKGVSCIAYHAGLNQEERERVQDSWMTGDVPVIAATVAFGMGVDKASVRFVAHWNVSDSLAAYYQESGRAGRDGRPSYARLYYNKDDAKKKEKWMTSAISNADAADKYIYLKKLEGFQHMIKEYCQSVICRHKVISNFFSQETNQCNTCCDICSDGERITKITERLSPQEINLSEDINDTTSYWVDCDISHKDRVMVGKTSYGYMPFI
jgi:ATP-dependent DNA helicase Q5